MQQHIELSISVNVRLIQPVAQFVSHSNSSFWLNLNVGMVGVCAVQAGQWTWICCAPASLFVHNASIAISTEALAGRAKKKVVKMPHSVHTSDPSWHLCEFVFVET